MTTESLPKKLLTLSLVIGSCIWITALFFFVDRQKIVSQAIMTSQSPPASPAQLEQFLCKRWPKQYNRYIAILTPSSAEIWICAAPKNSAIGKLRPVEIKPPSQEKSSTQLQT